jgi:hypothetical protein
MCRYRVLIDNSIEWFYKFSNNKHKWTKLASWPILNRQVRPKWRTPGCKIINFSNDAYKDFHDAKSLFDLAYYKELRR